MPSAYVARDSQAIASASYRCHMHKYRSKISEDLALSLAQLQAFTNIAPVTMRHRK